MKIGVLTALSAKESIDAQFNLIEDLKPKFLQTLCYTALETRGWQEGRREKWRRYA